LRPALHGGTGVRRQSAGTRLNRVWKDVMKEADLELELRPLLARYAKERTVGERFGDWVARAVWPEQVALAA
jgi:sulfite reductase (NADPH) hemoprotein beta-component